MTKLSQKNPTSNSYISQRNHHFIILKLSERNLFFFLEDDIDAYTLED